MGDEHDQAAGDGRRQPRRQPGGPPRAAAPARPRRRDRGRDGSPDREILRLNSELRKTARASRLSDRSRPRPSAAAAPGPARAPRTSATPADAPGRGAGGRAAGGPSLTRRIARRAAGIGPMTRPLFSIVTPVYDPPLDVFEETIASVLAQERADWEWILVDDFSPTPAVATCSGRRQRDPRIRLVERADNGHIVGASNDGIDARQGEFLVLLDHDDLLSPDALARERRRDRGAPRRRLPLLRRGQGRPRRAGTRRFRKPDWSPERLRGQMYTSHLSVMRTALVREVGGFREGYDGSQDHDLALRVERAWRVGSSTCPRCSTTGAPSPGRPRPTSTPSPTPRSPGSGRSRTSSTGSASRAASSQGASPAATSSSASSTRTRVSRHHPDLGSSALVWGSGACWSWRPCARCWPAPSTTTSRSSWSTTRPRPARCSTSCARSPATSWCWCSTTSRSTSAEKMNVGVPARHRRPPGASSTTTSR